jgi:plasmid stabilization system protein ParE
VFRDLDWIYDHIAEAFKAPETAKNMVDALEEAILSLDHHPYRGVERKVGVSEPGGVVSLLSA